ncbi:MAG: amidophosphoribosyltransferase [Verrucomicrobiales bacterium]|nr:amidophosphoribosyltransferase [Verrucomicrobiales bacterium]
MSDFIKHECGVALVRLRKPLEYYLDTYGTALYGFHKLFLLMEKQHNRGHDGMGIGCTKIGMPLGQPYMFRTRSARQDSLGQVFKAQQVAFDALVRKGRIDPKKPATVKTHFDFGGEILIGHLRYGTSGEFAVSSCHPYYRKSNWPTRNLMVLGNFNMTNTRQLNQLMVDRGQHPIFGTDTQTVLEEIGYHLDEQHTDIYRELRDRGTPGRAIPAIISERLDLGSVIRQSAQNWDGGYTIVGMVGNGDCFVLRDPHGIRPCFQYESDEFIAFASERVPLMTVFSAAQEEITEVEPGTVVSMKTDGSVRCERFAPEQPCRPCSFERIYFSRGNDPDIYQERKRLGAALVPRVLRGIDGDLERAIFSFIPNTAEVAYTGLMRGLRLHRRGEVKAAILQASRDGTLTEDLVDSLIMRNWPRGEKIAHKDIKLRTFISQEQNRLQLASHVYDVTYGEVGPADVLVVIDDSIVRGTTLKQSILKMLTRTNPRKILVASTAPQIRFPDCYGIDMAEIGKFIAFQAAIELLRDSGRQSVIDGVYSKCKVELEQPVAQMGNCVKEIYTPFSDEEIARRISRMIYPETSWKGELEVVFQTVQSLHDAISATCGDWYFTGDYPTPGGFEIVNRSFVHWYEGRDGRAYDV